MRNNISAVLLPVIFSLLFQTAWAQPADTIYVTAPNNVRMTSPPAGYLGWGVFPADTVSYRKVYLNFTLGCGGSCSGWDYTVQIFLRQNTHHLDSNLVQGPSFTVNGSQMDSVKVKFDTTYKTFYDTVTHKTDSTANSPYTIVQYKICAKPYVPTDTVHWWIAGYYNRYFDTTGKVIDSAFVKPDTSMYLTHCPYYSVFDSIASYELARMITPYGGYYPGNWTFPYRFDITDFSSLLHDSVQIEVFYSGWTNGFNATCQFEMITGTPDHNPYKVINMWNGTFPYGSSGNPISNYLVPKPMKIDTAAHATRLRVIQTGHGEDGNNCEEFCSNYNHILVNHTQAGSTFVWRDNCGMNPLWHQAGTWLFNRANWCPGALVNPYLYDLTNYVTRGATDTLDITCDPYTSPNGGSVYTFGTSLVYYSAPKFTLDAAVEDIISPNIYAPYTRYNPVCGSPEVLIRNTGSTTLTSLNFTYGELGGQTYNYTWNGSLPFDDTATVYLPPAYLKSAPSNIFAVTISNPNGGVDQYADNNYMQVKYDTVPTYPSSFIIQLSTNTDAASYSYFIEDAGGNIVDNKSGFANSTTYKDTVHLSPGCYHFELDAADEQGLYFWDNSYGAGNLYFKKTNGFNFKVFQNDFGTSIMQNFYVGNLTGIDNLSENIDYDVYPNPANRQLSIAGLNASAKTKQVYIYSSVGQLVYQSVIPSGTDMVNINVSNLSAGLYCVVVSNADGQTVKKVMIAR
ncbi:MAG: T9SS type A sorting domain-containing protein [Bacteroidia bacterium]|nr:T9SS type A sorting domain-containing protein [Bacteroidia bacterium]